MAYIHKSVSESHIGLANDYIEAETHVALLATERTDLSQRVILQRVRQMNPNFKWNVYGGDGNSVENHSDSFSVDLVSLLSCLPDNSVIGELGGIGDFPRDAKNYCNMAEGFGISLADGRPEWLKDEDLSSNIKVIPANFMIEEHWNEIYAKAPQADLLVSRLIGGWNIMPNDVEFHLELLIRSVDLLKCEGILLAQLSTKYENPFSFHSHCAYAATRYLRRKGYAARVKERVFQIQKLQESLPMDKKEIGEFVLNYLHNREV